MQMYLQLQQVIDIMPTNAVGYFQIVPLPWEPLSTVTYFPIFNLWFFVFPNYHSDSEKVRPSKLPFAPFRVGQKVTLL